MRTLMIYVLVLGCIVNINAFTQPQKVETKRPKSWTLIGSRQINWVPEIDVIHVGKTKGKFSKLKIKVTGGAIHMTKMVVTYGNGRKDLIPLKYMFRKGSESRVIDLKGGRRVVKNIAFVYDRKHKVRKARIWVAGRR
ncbi:hypothetical protein [Tenacibaculum sp. 190524A02b]|uniref:DUF2541 family protein n=1 Tax=Tenacibaculum vairaonense TaxID=3137860 RepID=A0ABP1F8D6_9FLAO